MSHALYSTVLLWSVTRGFAKLHGVLAAVGEPLTPIAGRPGLRCSWWSCFTPG